MLQRRDIISIGVGLLSLIACVVPRLFAGYYLYYQGQAVSVLGFIFAGYLYVSNKYVRILFEYLMCVAIANLFDETLGNPQEFGIIEKCVNIIFIVWTLYRVIKNVNEDKR